MEGDITHEQLSIDVGAFFQGRCAQFRPVAQAAPVAQPMQMLSSAPIEQSGSANVIELDHAAQR